VLAAELPAGASYATLVDALDGAYDAGVRAAGTLRDAIEDLDPAPAIVGEALGRLRFAGGEPVTLLSAVDEQTNIACARSFAAPEVSGSVESITPQPDSDGWVQVGAYDDACGQVVGLTARGENVVVIDCSTFIGLLDLDAGVLDKEGGAEVTRLPAEGVSDTADDVIASGEVTIDIGRAETTPAEAIGISFSVVDADV
jgi:hypothetical protein